MRRASRRELRASANVAGPPLSPLPLNGRALPGLWRGVLAMAVCLYVAAAWIHAARTPQGATGYQDAPDEAAHMTAVRVVAAGRLPTRERPGLAPDDGAPAYEWHQPPLYYALAACALPGGTLAVRALSILIGLACILTVYAAARVLDPGAPECAALAAAIVALVPGHIAITSVVNNDGLLELCFGLTVLLLLNGFRSGLSRRVTALLGVVLGAAMLTKATSVLLVPVIGLGLALIWRSGAPGVRVARSAAAIAVIALMLSGWWFARNAALYHEWLPITAFRQSFEGTVKATDVVAGTTGLHVDGWAGYALLVGRWTFQSFLAVYSTARGSTFGGPTFLPSQLYILVGVAGIAAAAGVAMSMFSRGRVPAIQRRSLTLLIAVTVLVLASFVAFASRYFQAQGRYLYPAMLPIALLTAFGWRTIFPARYANVAGVFLVCLLGALCVAFLRATG